MKIIENILIKFLEKILEKGNIFAQLFFLQNFVSIIYKFFELKFSLNFQHQIKTSHLRWVFIKSFDSKHFLNTLRVENLEIKWTFYLSSFLFVFLRNLNCSINRLKKALFKANAHFEPTKKFSISCLFKIIL